MTERVLYVSFCFGVEEKKSECAMTEEIFALSLLGSKLIFDKIK